MNRWWIVALVVVSFVLNGCASSAHYWNPQTGEVRICSKPVTYAWGWPWPILLATSTVAAAANIDAGVRYAHCKSDSEAAGLQRVDPS